MTMSDEQIHAARLRQAPVERFAGAEHSFDLAAEAARLRSEAHPAQNGHRQIVLFREDPVSFLLFDFQAGGVLTDHVADGVVSILTLSGHVGVRTPDAQHEVPTGALLVLRPGVTHDVTAPVAAQILVTIHLTTPEGA